MLFFFKNITILLILQIILEIWEKEMAFNRVKVNKLLNLI